MAALLAHPFAAPPLSSLVSAAEQQQQQQQQQAAAATLLRGQLLARYHPYMSQLALAANLASSQDVVESAKMSEKV